MPWLVETRYVAKNGFGQQLNEVKFPITKSDEEIDSKPDLKELLPGLRFDYPWFYSDNYWDMLYVNSYTSVDGNPRNVMGYQGLLYVYQQDALRQTRLIAVVGKDLVDDTETSQIPFDQLPRLLWNESIFPLAVNSTAVMGGDSNPSTRNNPSRIDSFAIAATDGIYQVDFESGKVERILDMNLRAYSSSIQADENSGTKHLAIWDGSSVTMFQTVGQALNGPFKVGERIATLAIPNDFARKLQSGDVCFDYRDPDNWTIAIGYSTRPGINQQYEVVRSNQKEIQNYTVGIPQSLSVSSVDGARREGLLVSSMAPPVVLATFGTIAYILGNPMHDGFGYIGFIAAQAILSGILAILAARCRGLSAWQVASWCAGGLLIGLGTWFLVLSIYPRVFSTKCPACNRNRRIEREKCESCGAEWEPIAPLGIELFEGSNLGADAIGQTAPATLAVDRHQA